MDRYKSLFVVMIMGGIMLVMGGTVLQAEGIKRKKTPPGSRRGSLTTAALRTGSIEFRDRSVEHDLAEIRQLLKAEAVKSGRRDRLVAVTTHLKAILRPRHIAVLTEEWNRSDSAGEYRGVLLGLIGATRNVSGLKIIEAGFVNHPFEAVRALVAHGGAAALVVVERIYSRTEDPVLRMEVTGGLAKFQPRVAAPMLARVLNRETDEDIMRELLLASRRCPDDALIASISAVVVRDGVSFKTRRRAIAALANGVSKGGHQRLFELWSDEGVEAGLRRTAARSFSFIRNPVFVSAVLPRLDRCGDLADDLLRYLDRNLGPEHREALESMRERGPASVRAMIERRLALLDD